MKDYKQIPQIVKQIKQSKNIIIVVHSFPDGDAIGSALAMYHFLKNINKVAKILLNDPIPDNLYFLDGVDEIEIYDKGKHFENFLLCDTIIMLDLNGAKRMGRLADSVVSSSAKKIMIDHHEQPENFCNFYLSDPEVISTASLVYEVISQFDEPITKSIAEGLYVGIMTDSGNFRFPRTTEQTHLLIADLIKNGADPTYLYERIYSENSLSQVKILGMALANMTTHLEGKLSVMLIDAEMFNKCGAKNSDVDSFAEKTLSIKGSIAGILLSDMDSKDHVRISLRSRGDFNIQEVAKSLGGGGHFHASGAREFNLDIYQTKNFLIDTIEKAMVRQGII